MNKLRYIFLLISAVLTASAISVSAQPKNSFFEKGYKADIQVSAIPHSSYGIKAGSLTSTHGYCFGNGLFLGGGTGISFDRDNIDSKKAILAIPFYGEVTYCFMNRMVSPLVGVRAGAVSDYTTPGPGFFVRPYVGVNIWKFSVYAGLDFQSFRYRTEVYSEGTVRPTGHSSFNLQQLSMMIGLSYNF